MRYILILLLAGCGGAISATPMAQDAGPTCDGAPPGVNFACWEGPKP